MALTDQGTSTTMLVQPSGYMGGGFNNGAFGGDWAWIILLLLAFGGGWGMGGFGGGFGGGLGYDFPWLLNGQNGINNNISGGFRDAQLHDSITSVRDGVSNLATQLCGCCGDMQMAMANGFAGTAAAITGASNSLAQQINANELASLNRSFAEQTANMQGFNAVQAGLADAKYVEATEACATRTAAASNTRDIIDAQTRGTQAILDKLCALELDGVKGQLAQAQRENVALQNAVNMANMQASQVSQTAQILAGQTAEVDALYNRLKNCPVNTVPVAGNTPLFSCNPSFNNGGCPCGGNGFVG